MEISSVMLALIKPSPTNPRKKFDDSKLQELAESIKEKGVLQPILVRPLPQQGYQLIAGERRFRAAKLAGLRVIPAVVKELDDLAALEIQVIENDQREDVLPTERAHAYRQLLKAGRTIQQIAAKVGKSETTIRDALRIADLPEKAAEAADSGVISRAVAQLIGRVPNEKTREKVALLVLNGRTNPNSPLGQTEPLNVRQTEELIREHFVRELKSAPFSWKDDTLPPGSCLTCKKRAANAGEEYKTVRGDMCLDTVCFHEKAKLNAERKEKSAVEDGFTLLTKDQLEMLFHGGDRLFSTGIFAWLDTKLDFAFQSQITEAGGPEFKTLKGFLGDRLKDLEIFLGFSPISKTRCEFVSYDEVKKIVDELYPSKREKRKPPTPKPVAEKAPESSSEARQLKTWEFSKGAAEAALMRPMVYNKIIRLMLAAIYTNQRFSFNVPLPSELSSLLFGEDLIEKLLSDEAQKPGTNSVTQSFEKTLLSWASWILASHSKDGIVREVLEYQQPIDNEPKAKPTTKKASSK